MSRQQKITLGEMRRSGPRRLLIYCGDYRCAHSVVLDAAPWGDDVRRPISNPSLLARSAADAKQSIAIDPHGLPDVSDPGQNRSTRGKEAN